MTAKERSAVIAECAAVARTAAAVWLRMGGNGRNDLQRTFQTSGAAASTVADQIDLLKEHK